MILGVLCRFVPSPLTDQLTRKIQFVKRPSHTVGSGMSFLNEHKLLVGAVGIALSSAAAGYVISRIFIPRSSFDTPFKVCSEDSPVSKYVMKH